MGRHQIPINWDIIEKKMEAGCTAREIAAGLHMDETTFGIRVKQKYGKLFTEKLADFHSYGKGSIRFTQYIKAISGNIPMLTLLGREWLGQDGDKQSSPANDDLNFLRHMLMLREAEMQN